MVGPSPMLGLNGHSAALINPLRSSFRNVHIPWFESYSGCCIDGENVAYSCTWVSTVKLLIEKDASSGARYSSIADSISHDEGVDVGVKRDIVMWYIGAYFRDLVVRRASLSANSGDKVLDKLDLCSRVGDEFDDELDEI